MYKCEIDIFIQSYSFINKINASFTARRVKLPTEKIHIYYM